jgi:protein-S-isoprenylcysteine O-methyltransferase Ste14
MGFDVRQAVALPWLALAGFWLVTALGAKRALRVQSTGSRLYHCLLMATAFALLFRPQARIGQLGWRMVASPTAAYTGLALTIVGAGFAIWARMTLGGNWSATITEKENHALIDRGPYQIVRHPIYAGGLVAMLGTALVYGEAGCFLAVLVALLAWWFKARVEEEFMTRRFGDQYRRYQREVKRLIPFVL